MIMKNKEWEWGSIELPKWYVKVIEDQDLDYTKDKEDIDRL